MFKKKVINIMKACVFSDFEILGGKFMNKNFKSKLVAGLMTTAMIFSSAAAFAPVHAEDKTALVTGTETSVPGPKLETGFKKFLKLKDGTIVPNVTFNFTISPGKAQTASKNAD